MKLTFVLRNKQNALKLSTKTIDSFIERIKTDTKDGAVARRRHELNLFNHATSYDLCIDSSQLGLLDTEKFIAEFVRRRFGIHK